MSQADDRQRGSVMVLVIFVLVLLTGMGVALLTSSQNEMKMGKAALGNKSAFYLAEAGLENARSLLFQAGASAAQPLSLNLTDAAGENETMDFDPGLLQVSFNSAGTPVLSGYGDDVPLMAPTRMGSGFYAAFITNDPADGDPLLDTNQRLLVTGIGIDQGSAIEMVQATIEPEPILPTLPPAMILMLGPTPSFDGGEGTCTTDSSEPEPDPEPQDEGGDESDEGGDDEGDDETGDEDDDS